MVKGTYGAVIIKITKKHMFGKREIEHLKRVIELKDETILAQEGIIKTLEIHLDLLRELLQGKS